ncbi:MAG TPA: GyrI-like domain-containing protein [Bacillota bacterium]|nr:GyrI-like domain-containing protein [Bacillota bacterium]
MSETAKKMTDNENPESYSPQIKPKFIEVMSKLGKTPAPETLVSQVNDFCSIVDLAEKKVVGVKIVFDGESRKNVFGIAKKYVISQTLKSIEGWLGNKNPGQYIGVCKDILGAGHLSYIIGVEVDNFEELPEGLPENTIAVTCPAGRFAKLTAQDGAQMPITDYFANRFPNETPYVYHKGLLPYHLFNQHGVLQAIYNPVKEPQNDDERFDSVSFDIVTLPEIKFAGVKKPEGAVCNEEQDILFAYFNIQDQVKNLPCAENYTHEYLGFPWPENGVTYSCFGSQVDEFADFGPGIDTISIDPGLYVHIKQLEFNGDDPGALYQVCFNHLNRLFFEKHPDYIWDPERVVIARFRLGTSASLFAPIKRK